MEKFFDEKVRPLINGKAKPGCAGYWPKLIFVLVVINLLSAFLFSQIILEARILVPSLYVLLQIVSYGIEQIVTNTDGPLVWNVFVFYVGGFFINVPLLIFSYYKIGRSYTIRSLVNIAIFSLMGLLFSLRVVHDWIDGLNLGSNLVSDDDSATAAIQLNEIVKKVSYYLLIVFTAVVSGLLWSFLWKNQMSGGGLDIFYTYLARKTHLPIQRLAMPINFVFVVISIFSTAAIAGELAELKAITVLAMLMGSLAWGYILLTVMNQIYPKFVVVQVWIVTCKGNDVLKKMREQHQHGGFVIQTHGMYDARERLLISTSITYIEVPDTLKLVKKIDNGAIFIINPIKKFYGHFQWQH